VLQEKVLSAIVEFKVPFARLGRSPTAQRAFAGPGHRGQRQPDRLQRTGRPDPLEDFLTQNGIGFYPNGKVNIGLGRPLAVI